MKRILLAVVLCFGLCISCASGVGIKNGNFTSYSGSIAYNWTKVGNPQYYEGYTGTYRSAPASWFLFSVNGVGFAGLSQSVDLTNAQSLTFFGYNGGSSTRFYSVRIDGVQIYSSYAGSPTWYNHTTTNITGYTGYHTVAIGLQDNDASGSMSVFLDDVSIRYASAPPAPPLSISSYSPSSGPTSYYEATQAFSVTLNQIANSTWYVDNILRKTENSVKTTTYSNSTAGVGSHTVRCNSTNANGSTSLSWTWTVSDIPGLTVALLDESSGSRITPASVTLFNTTYTNTGDINETGQYAFLSYIGMTNGEYILSATADGYYPAHGNVNLTLASDTEAYMYLVADDVNDSTALYERFRLIDNSHQYNLSDCQVRLDKVYDSGVATVFQSNFDYQGYAATWLSVTDQYMLYVICPDRTITYGYFTPDPDGLVEIVITDTMPELWNEWLNYEISGDSDSGLISAVYESQKSIDVVDVWITYSENSTQAYHSNSTAANASFYFSGNTDYTYLVRMVATAADGDTIEVSQMITWDSGGVQPERLPMLPTDAPDWLKNMLSIAFILLCVLVLGQIRYDLASIIGGLFTAFFWYTGNLKVEGGVVAVIAIIAVAAYMHRSRRE